MSRKHTSILNVNIFPLTYQKTLQYIQSQIFEKNKTYICVAAVHLVMECQKDKDLLEGINSAGLVTTDGTPLVWLLKLNGEKEIERIYGPTLMKNICNLAEKKNYKIFLLGGAKGQSQELSQKLLKYYPKLRIVGFQDTPKRTVPKGDDKRIIKKINSSGAQIVFLGMGCPFQERWMIKNRKKLNANILIGVGAAFDYITGRVKQAPPWIQNMGFEWLFRFIQDPRRLWYRYTVTNFNFLYKATGEVVSNYVNKRRN